MAIARDPATNEPEAQDKQQRTGQRHGAGPLFGCSRRRPGCSLVMRDRTNRRHPPPGRNCGR